MKGVWFWTLSLLLFQFFSIAWGDVTSCDPILGDVESIPEKRAGIEKNIKRFESWLVQKGATFPKLKIAIFPTDDLNSFTYVGAVSKEIIKPGEALLTIPNGLIFRPRPDDPLSVVAQVIKSDPRILQEGTLLAFRLLEEYASYKIGTSKKWGAYMEMLPTSYPEMPMFWNQDQLDLIEGSYTLERVQADVAGLLNEYEEVIARLKEIDPTFASDDYSREKYLWAWATIWSRAFSIRRDDDRGNEQALIPLADMLNHNDRATTQYQSDRSKGFTMWTARNGYRAGREVFNNYTPRSNSELLRLYGFMIAENPIRSIPIHMPEISEDDALQILHRTLEQDGRLPWPYTKNYLVSSEEHPKELMAYLRILQCADIGCTSEFDPFKPMSKKNEIKVQKNLRNLLENAIERFSTTLQDDDVLLKSGKLGDIERLAVEIRREEKQILTSALALI